MAKNMGGNVTSGTASQGELGRAGQDTRDPGAGKLIAPLTTSTSDLRDKGHAKLTQNIAATREPPAVKPGKGNHNKHLLGG